MSKDWCGWNRLRQWPGRCSSDSADCVKDLLLAPNGCIKLSYAQIWDHMHPLLDLKNLKAFSPALQFL